MSVRNVGGCSLWRSEEGADLKELELQMFGNHRVDEDQTWTWVLWKRSQCSSRLSHLSSPFFFPRQWLDFSPG